MLFKKEQFQVLKIKDFRHFILGRFLYIAALRMVFTSVGFLVYEITKSKFQLGLIGLSEVIPAIGFALYAGIIVDKSNKRKLILQAEILYFFSCVLQLYVVYLYSKGLISAASTVSLFYLGMFISGVIRSFNGPAQNAIIAQLVPRALLLPASTISSLTWLIAAVTGPVISGVLLAFFNPTVIFIVIAVFVLFSVYCKFHISPTEILVKKEINNWGAIKEGIRFVFKTKIILGALTLDLFAVLFGGAVALLPVYAKDILHVNTFALGWLNSAEYIGSFVVLTLLIMRPVQKKQGVKLLWAVTGFGIGTILFAVSTSFWFSMFSLIAIGLFDGVSVVIRANILQLFTPDEMRGRVSSVNSMFINSSNEIGQFESGMAASLIGTVPSVIFGGCMTLLVVFFVWYRAPSLKKLQY